jgi:autotransporter-associated beta strand protein
VLISGGVPGSTNIISAPIVLRTGLSVDATSTNNLAILGTIQASGQSNTLTYSVPAGELTLTSNVLTWDAAVPLTARTVGISGAAGVSIIHNEQILTGDGTSTGAGGGVNLGGASANSGALFTTHHMNVAQPNWTTGTSFFSNATLIVKNDLALGSSTIQTNGGWQAHLQSDNPARTLPNNFTFSNGFVVDGANSLTLSGWMLQMNNRAFVNNLDPGATLTLSGAGNGDSIYIFESTDVSNTRVFIVDGRGHTIVNGRIMNDETLLSTTTHHMTKRGTGTLVLNNVNNDYLGETRANGGLIVFGANETWGQGSIVAFTLGSIWYAPGSADTNFNDFINKISNASVGALAIPASEAATNFDFTAAPLSNISSMSIGAQGAVSYTGTVTPGSNGYFWGGMTGVLTLSGNNRMIGASNVTYANGGTVIVPGTQSYTGSTTIAGGNLPTGQFRADRRDSGSTNGSENILTTTVLEISSIANGGVASGLGASTSDASNLQFTGGTLRYVGPAADTDRLFSIGTFGGTIDSSGTGALRFVNAGDHGGFGDPARTLTLTGTSAGANTIAGKLNNAGNLSVTKSGAGQWILNGANDYTGTTTVSGGTLVAGNAAAFGTGTLNVTAGRAQLANGFAVAMIKPAVTIGDAGSVDIGNNDLVIDYPDGGPNPTLVEEVRGHLLAGRLLSSSAGTPPGSRVGYGDNFVLQKTEFGGIPVNNDMLLIKFTYAGDADLNGQVDVADLGALASNWQTSAPWTSGDFDYSGFVDVADLGLLASNWQSGVGSPLGPSLQEALASAGLGHVVVPEPASGALVGTGMLLALRRRRSR